MPNKLQKICCLLVLLFVVFAAYSNTFNASWHFDDYSNIVHDNRLHLSDLNIKSITRALFFSDDKGDFAFSHRPIARLSFALNWYFSKNHVAGYHAVNLAFHLLTALFLFFTIQSLLTTPKFKEKYHQNIFFIAILSTSLWALNPIQTQAVTYIVQRMAVMAAMFYVLAIYFYLKARMAQKLNEQIVYAICVIFCYFLAIGSKENAAILPLTLILIEIVCFQSFEKIPQNKSMFICFLILGATVIISIFLLLIFKINDFMGVYEIRPFSLTERLLTEFRVLIFYLTEIFYPIPQRLSIDNDIIVSTSLFTPWTTLPSIIFVCLLLFLAVFSIRKSPIFSFAILFFFLNHVIESSILPLELIFEHRNYLPSFFIFMPIVAGLMHLVNIYRKKNTLLYVSCLVFMYLLPLFYASGTYIRNMAWKSEMSLWRDAVEKSPNSARCTYSLAKVYSASGDLDTALNLYNKSIELSAARPLFSIALAYNGMASVFFMRHNYEKAILYSQKALDIDPSLNDIRYNLISSLVKANQFTEALNHLDVLLSSQPRDPKFLLTKGVIMMNLDRPNEALICFQKGLTIVPENVQLILYTGKAFSSVDNFQKAEWFFKRASRLAPKNIHTWLSLVEISIRRGNEIQLKEYLEQLFSRFTIEQVYNSLSNDASLSITAFKSATDIIKPLITDYLSAIAIKFENHTEN